jgi:hypothetical protein
VVVSAVTRRRGARGTYYSFVSNLLAYVLTCIEPLLRACLYGGLCFFYPARDELIVFPSKFVDIQSIVLTR